MTDNVDRSQEKERNRFINVQCDACDPHLWEERQTTQKKKKTDHNEKLKFRDPFFNQNRFFFSFVNFSRLVGNVFVVI